MYAQNLLEEGAAVLSLGKGWPEESPHKEELASLQVSKNLHLPDTTVRKAIQAGLTDDWSEVTRSAELNLWIDVQPEGEPHPGDAGCVGERKKHRAEGHAKDDRLLEATHRASPRTGRPHTVVRVPLLPPIPA